MKSLTFRSKSHCSKGAGGKITRVGHICFSHCQIRVDVGLTHLIENRYDTLVSVMLASRCENGTMAILPH